MKIVFDDMEEDVDGRIGTLYNLHLQESKARLISFVQDHYPEGLEGPVYQPLGGRDPNVFSVLPKIPEDLFPGRLRRALRIKFNEQLGEHMDREFMNQREFLGFIFGGLWRRELVAQSKIIRWINGKGHEYTWFLNRTDAFRMKEGGVSLRIRAAWVDR